jgi:hypothetical protein
MEREETGHTGHSRSLQAPTVTPESGPEEGRKPLLRHNGVGRTTVRFPQLHRVRNAIYQVLCERFADVEIPPPSPQRCDQGKRHRDDGGTRPPSVPSES